MANCTYIDILYLQRIIYIKVNNNNNFKKYSTVLVNVKYWSDSWLILNKNEAFKLQTFKVETYLCFLMCETSLSVFLYP